jgi:hypothetical protein
VHGLVSDVVKEGGLKSIDALRAALLSPAFYKHENLCHCFCTGIEAGILRDTEEPMHVQRLEELLSAARAV